MAAHHPGVEQVQVYVAISLVRPWSNIDTNIMDAILHSTDRCQWLQPVFVILKDNVGRDFSSAKKCIQQMEAHTTPEDYVLVRNRSSRGPRIDHWYSAYVDQFNRHKDSGLTGSTLNLKDHFSRGEKTNVAHVQTYAYMSRYEIFSQITDDFPGEQSKSHLEAILQGEIGLSQRILSMGYSISALHQPSLIINAGNQNEDNVDLNLYNVDDLVIPIVHRRRYSVKTKKWQKIIAYSRVVWNGLKRNKKWVYFNC